MVIDDGALPRDFPLSLANNGQYSKKHQGKRYQFGAESRGWKAALAKWHHDWPFILLGKLPPPMPVDGEPDPATWEYLATKFIEREEKRRRRKQLVDSSFLSIRAAVEIAVTHCGKTSRPLHMVPDDWADLRDALGALWIRQGDGEAAKWVKTADRVGVEVLGHRIIHVRAMFHWAGPDEAKLLPVLPAWLDSFAHVTNRTKKKSKNNRERERGGAKLWPATQIEPIYNALDEQLQAMFLLSLNCGFTAADCSAIPWRAVDLDKGLIDFPRVKTGIDRMRLPLWPETIKALRRVKALNLSPAPGMADFIIFQDRGDGGEAIGQAVTLKDCVFITSKGRPWVINKVKCDSNGIPVTESHHDLICVELNKRLVKLGIKRNGVGFSAGRHTFETHGLRVADKALVDWVMGHSTGEMSQNYDHALDEDLKALAFGVRDRLLADGMKLPDPQKRAESTAAGAGPTMKIAG